ncbi:MAG: hypothetical protein V1681_00340, partial [Candidatus Neomarinimicrobiota bacterium]
MLKTRLLLPKSIFSFSTSTLASTLALTLTLISFSGCSSKSSIENNELAVTFKGDAKIEVGGPFVGAEFHHSYMIPQRISFFYPVANSIDRSQDYWKRDTSFVAEWFLKIGEGQPEVVG